MLIGAATFKAANLFMQKNGGNKIIPFQPER